MTREQEYGVADTNECPANPRWSRPRRAIAIGLAVAAKICRVGYCGAATQHLRCAHNTECVRSISLEPEANWELGKLSQGSSFTK